MSPSTKFRIEISQPLSRTTPTPGQTCWARTHVGPSDLLSWLETQLALTGSSIPFTDRVTRYASLLEDHDGETYRRSFEADRWATAAELLQRRDELRMAGWDGTDDLPLPALVRDLAVVEETSDVPPGTPDRLEAVLKALGDVQTLPPHECVLEEPVDWWPPLWRQVLSELDTEQASDPAPAATSGTTLAGIQTTLLGQTTEPNLQPDGSVHALQALSAHEACQAVAAMLARDDGDLETTVVYTPDPSVASLMDGALARLGLPTMGARRDQVAQPALQVLPLVVEMLWEPVDPHIVLDFLSLPVGPIPSDVAGDLAEALAEEPGLGSSKWEEKWEECTDAEADPDGEIAERLERWFDHDRVPLGDPVPASWVKERCGKVAQWARGHAEMLDDNNPEDEALIEPLQTAATQAAALGQLAETQGGALPKPQLVRMLEDVRSTGARAKVHPTQARGPILVETLGDVPDTCERLIWLGTGLEDEPTSRWTKRQREALADLDIEIDDGARELQAIRAAERRGLARVDSALLVVQLPADADRRPHPIWVRTGELLPDLSIEDLHSLGDAVATDLDLSPWRIETRDVSVDPPQPERPLWDLPSELLAEPSYTSRGEMRDRLGCPIRWVFKRVAKIDSSGAASLPDEFLLKGRFSHRILERVFGDGGEPPPVDEAVEAVSQCFDERIDLDAAPLAQPAELDERKQLRQELRRATRVFVETLHRGGYRIVGIEEDLETEIDGRPLLGSIDALVEGEAREAIIDFKYAGKKHRRRLEDGRAIQLAVYAAGRSRQTGGDIPAVAYLVLRSAQLHTPAGSPLDGIDPTEQVHKAPSIDTVWRRFLDAFDRSWAWLEGDEPVPAWPLHDEEAWPAGADMVIDADEDGKDRQPCRYCDFDVLCGLRRCE